MQVDRDCSSILADVCEGLLTMFRPLAEKKNIDLRGSTWRRTSPAAPGRGQVPADPVEPAVQRDQVHAGRRPRLLKAEGRCANILSSP